MLAACYWMRGCTYCVKTLSFLSKMRVTEIESTYSGEDGFDDFEVFRDDCFVKLGFGVFWLLR